MKPLKKELITLNQRSCTSCGSDCLYSNPNWEVVMMLLCKVCTQENECTEENDVKNQ